MASPTTEANAPRCSSVSHATASHASLPPAQRARCKIGGGEIALHWPELDEDLSIAGLMAGVDWRSA